MSTPSSRTTSKRSGMSGEDRMLLFGLPILVIAIVGGWAIWRAQADLGDIEARQLAWDVVAALTWEHIVLVVISTALVLITAIPVGIILTRPKTAFLAPFAQMVANAGQAAPVIGVIVLLAIWLGFGLPVAVLSLVVYAFLPVLANTVTGLSGVDKALIESSRGMGMFPLQVLVRIELPLAIPVIMSGVRTALVLLVGTATFAVFIDAGGLGQLIDAGIKLYRTDVLVSGALLVAALALIIEWLGRVVEHLVQPKGMR